MKRYFVVVFAAALCAIVLNSCAKNSGLIAPAPVVDYREACADANLGKTIAVESFLNIGEKTPCYVRDRESEKLSCGFKLMDTMNVVGQEIIGYLPEGKDNNQIETPNGGQKTSIFTPMKIYARNEVKIHLNDGTVITPQENIATPVTVTGEVHPSEGTANKSCVMNVSKVEKREAK